MKVVSSALRTGRFYTRRKYSSYSFLLEAESTPGPYCGRKDYVKEKFQCHHRESNPRPSGLVTSSIRTDPNRTLQRVQIAHPIWEVLGSELQTSDQLS